MLAVIMRVMRVFFSYFVPGKLQVKVIEMVGGTLPDCWSGMKNLRTFYCFSAAIFPGVLIGSAASLHSSL